MGLIINCTPLLLQCTNYTLPATPPSFFHKATWNQHFQHDTRIKQISHTSANFPARRLPCLICGVVNELTSNDPANGPALQTLASLSPLLLQISSINVSGFAQRSNIVAFIQTKRSLKLCTFHFFHFRKFFNEP